MIEVLLNLMLALSSSAVQIPGFFSDRDIEDLRVRHLEFVRRAIVSHQGNAELFEKIAGLIDSPKGAKRLYEAASDFRRRVAELRLEERKLWEEQPGGIEAPMPREVKRKR